MYFFSKTHSKLAALATLALLAGCSSDSSSPLLRNANLFNPQGSVQLLGAARLNTRDSLLASSKKDRVFLSMPLTGSIYIFPERGHNPPPVGEITVPPSQAPWPLGLATDKSANLYVAYQNLGAVFVYAPPYTKYSIIAKLAQPSQVPISVAVSAQGLIAVLNDNCPSASHCNPSNVMVYKNLNSITYPCATVGDTFHFTTVAFGAFDAKGNLYIDGQNAVRQETFGEISGGCQAKSISLLPIRGVSGAGLQIDRAGSLAILDSANKELYTYDPAKGKKIGSTPLRDSQSPENFAFSSSGKYLFTADINISQEYAYPKGGAAISTLSPNPSAPPNQLFGVAVTPPFKQ